ncbi:MAG: ABC transporter ATP-binding protein [Bacteroidales bacterium]|nr:ABC transporter ATP-binding protein [Bacteroidales bacterium]
MEPIITTTNLSKIYVDVKAVDGINLSIKKGEIYGFLGLNGAGKTTTIRMLLGMISPTNGEAHILGQKVHPNNTDLWKNIGHLVEIPYSYPNLTVRENLEIIRKLRFIDDKKAIDRIIEKLELTRYADRRAKHLSLGNYQRLGLAKALIHNPEILILDEPTNGLDPAGIHEVREMLIGLAENDGKTIFISSHILGEIAKIATRIGIIHNGKMIDEFDTKNLDTLCDKNLFIKSKDINKAFSILKNANIQNCEISDNTLIIKDLEAIKNPDKIAELLVKSDCSPTLLHVKEENLESYFLKTIKKTEE